MKLNADICPCNDVFHALKMLGPVTLVLTAPGFLRSQTLEPSDYWSLRCPIWCGAMQPEFSNDSAAPYRFSLQQRQCMQPKMEQFYRHRCSAIGEGICWGWPSMHHCLPIQLSGSPPKVSPSMDSYIMFIHSQQPLMAKAIHCSRWKLCGVANGDRNANWLYIMVSMRYQLLMLPRQLLFIILIKGPLKTLFSLRTCRNLLSTTIFFDSLVPNMYDGRRISRHI